MWRKVRASAAASRIRMRMPHGRDAIGADDESEDDMLARPVAPDRSVDIIKPVPHAPLATLSVEPVRTAVVDGFQAPLQNFRFTEILLL